MSRSPVRSAAFLLCALLTGCFESREQATTESSCGATCHGDSTTAAPPKDLEGFTSISSPGVGAHRLHLNTRPDYPQVKCEECHVVPAAVSDPGHADDPPPADLTFRGLASAGDRNPAYDPSTRTCSDSYCHSGPQDAVAPWPGNPNWTNPLPEDQRCGRSCHSNPPGGTHPNSMQCENCHAPTAGPSVTILSALTHMNGTVDVSIGDACNVCHGNSENAAPPVDLQGSEDTTRVTVGAHQQHLRAGALSAATPCSTCHIVPEAVGSPGHLDESPNAEVTFSGLATAQQAAPQWVRPDATCADTYCHGATLAGGTNTAPVWNRVGDGQAACGSCHGLPPPAPHPNSTACERCHEETAGPGLTIINAASHINGVLEVRASICNACHGSEQNDAPPVSLSGSSSTTDIGVGAHQAHLAGGTGSKPVPCGSCHVVPQDFNDPGHIDPDGIAEVTFSGIANQETSSEWQRASATCVNSYCHGATLPGGTNDAPVWTQGSAQVVCGSCHALPPPLPHPRDSDCQKCHIPPAGSTARDVHIDGKVDIPGGPCAASTQCHGNGEVFYPTNDPHRRHVEAAAMIFAEPFSCDVCHQLPPVSTKHLNGVVDLDFTGISRGNEPGQNKPHTQEPIYSANTCSQVYCHGDWEGDATLSGGAVTQPRWESGTNQVFCGSCHSIPPPDPHTANANCQQCHSDVIPVDGPFNTELHVNGKIEL